MQDLGLGKTVNTIIGDERARGVSGGERKRVSIGVGEQVMPCCSSASRGVGLRTARLSNDTTGGDVLSRLVNRLTWVALWLLLCMRQS